MTLKPLTERDLSTLRDLTPSYSDEPRRWERPLDLGGGSRSHHSATLTKLEKRGLAESIQRSGPSSRGSKQYRVTDAGQALVEETFGPLKPKAEFLKALEARLAARRAARNAG